MTPRCSRPVPASPSTSQGHPHRTIRTGSSRSSGTSRASSAPAEDQRPGELELEMDRLRTHYNTARLHEGIGYVTPHDEHHGRGKAIRAARRAGLAAAQTQRLAAFSLGFPIWDTRFRRGSPASNPGSARHARRCPWAGLPSRSRRLRARLSLASRPRSAISARRGCAAVSAPRASATARLAHKAGPRAPRSRTSPEALG
jgi:hypothetical protein